MPLTARGLDTIREDYPQVYEALQSIVSAVNQQGALLGTDPAGTVAAPSNSGTIDVTQDAGLVSVQIQDPAPQRLVEYHIEFDTDPGFLNARLVSNGPSRNVVKYMGALTTYWRFYKQLPGSPVSEIVYFGTAEDPTAVVGTGSGAPTLQPTTGSGTSPVPGGGFGPLGPIPPPQGI